MGRRAKPAERGRIDCYEAFELDELAGRTCWGGLDLAVVNDLSSMAYVFPWEDDELDELYRLYMRYWLPEARAWELRDVVPYQRWADAGWIDLTEGNEVDFPSIAAAIAADAEKFLLQELRYDRAYATPVMQQLEADHGIVRKEFPQTIMHFTLPAKYFERLIKKRAIRHNGNPVMTWQIGNVKVKEDPNGNIRPVRPAKGDPRTIDGVVAAIMGLSGALENAGGVAGCYYDTHDPEFI